MNAINVERAIYFFLQVRTPKEITPDSPVLVHIRHHRISEHAVSVSSKSLTCKKMIIYIVFVRWDWLPHEGHLYALRYRHRLYEFFVR